MPDLTRDGNGDITPLAQNYRKANLTSQFGTRKLAFYSFTCDQDLELAYKIVGGNPDFNQPVWQESGSLYFQVVRALQEAGVELFWVGQPHNTNEEFYENWGGFGPSDADSFIFAIKDDADSPDKYLEDTYDLNATATNDWGQDWITLDSDPNLNIGQKVIFSGNVFGGIVAGKTYYVADYEYDSGNSYIKVSETVTSTVNDITFPNDFGVPGEVLTLTTDTGSMGAVIYYYDVYWQGTAGDTIWACCFDPEYSYVNAWNLGDHIDNNVDLNSWWNVVRCQPTWGIFPAYYGS